MALITRTCSSRGASVIFTIDDVTLRATQVQWIAVANVLRILIFDNFGNVAVEINTGVDVSPKLIDVAVRLVQITKSDLTTKSFLSPPFAVYFP